MSLFAPMSIAPYFVFIDFSRVDPTFAFERPNRWKDILTRGNIGFSPYLSMPFFGLSINLVERGLFELLSV